MGHSALPLHDAGNHRRRQRHSPCQPVRRDCLTRRPSPPGIIALLHHAMGRNHRLAAACCARSQRKPLRSSRSSSNPVRCYPTRVQVFRACAALSSAATPAGPRALALWPRPSACRFICREPGAAVGTWRGAGEGDRHRPRRDRTDPAALHGPTWPWRNVMSAGSKPANARQRFARRWADRCRARGCSRAARGRVAEAGGPGMRQAVEAGGCAVEAPARRSWSILLPMVADPAGQFGRTPTPARYGLCWPGWFGLEADDNQRATPVGAPACRRS
jgi:hypothetical protein